jgi:predicted RNA binding protein YcfA (HicA-like mRNA interferase family)
VTARGVINRLRREGWAERTDKPGLIIFTKPGLDPIVVPRHDGHIPKGTLRSICRILSWGYPPHH